MGKLALWVLVAVAVMLLVRMLGPGKQRTRVDREGTGGKGSKGSESETGQRRGNADELILGCAVCGVHIPSSDAVFARGKVYCGAEHRDQDEAGSRRGRDGGPGADGKSGTEGRPGAEGRPGRGGEGRG